MELNSESKVFGFWVYLMTDLVIFAVLFATFFVLRFNTFGGPSAKELFEMPFALLETLVLLTSSFTCALAMLGIHQKRKKFALLWFLVTIALGITFLYLEFSEFFHFVQVGASWERSAFLSSFFALVGTHGLHVCAGVLWMIVSLFHIVLRPLNLANLSRIFRMALFWHFLDVIWIFIFTTVYGMGHLL